MEQYRNFFKNWFGQLVGRVIRLDQYLLERAASAPNRVKAGPNFLSDLLTSLDALADDLLAKATYLLVDKSVQDHRYHYYAFARTAAEQYRRIHALTTYIPTPWPSPELELFLRKVLEECGLSLRSDNSTHIPWTILLSGEYNFSHILTAPQGVVTGQQPLQNLLNVPNAEKDNPLMWPNLLHEIAHVIGDEEGVITAGQTQLPTIDATPQSREILAGWTPEIIADLIAADYLGLAYFGAFVNFATYWVPFSLRTPTMSHPAPSSRVDYLYKRLRGRPAGFDAALETLHSDYHMRVELDQEDSTAREALFDTIRNVNSSDRPFPSEEELSRYVNKIVALSEYKQITPLSFDEAKATRITELANQLKEGRLISSHRDDSVLGTFNSLDDVLNDYKAAKNKLKEVPNDVRHIVNAALIRRLSHSDTMALDDKKNVVVGFYTGLLHSFCKSRSRNMRKRLRDLRPIVNNLDAVISKSMEAALVMAFYQEYERRES